jgi:hypothetical protein
MKKNNLIKLIILISLSIIAIINSGCDSSTTSGAAPIFLQITSGPKKDEIITTDRITFTWAGNDKGYKFKYALYYVKRDKSLELIDSSSWDVLTRTTFAYLDDGNYQFEVQGMFRNIYSKVTRNFTVDAVKGPLIKFFRTRKIVALNDSIKINVWLEDVSKFLSGDLNIQFDKSYLYLDSVSTTNFEDFNNADLVGVILPDWKTIKDNTNSKGILTLSYAVANNGSNSKEGITGSGSVLTLHFVTKRLGSTTLKVLTNSKLLDVNGKQISLKTPKDGYVVIQ